MRRAVLAAVVLVLCAGCATVPPPAAPVAHTPPPARAPQPTPSPASNSTPPSTAPDGGLPVGTTASGGTIRVQTPPISSAPAGIDSTPSPEAIAVLKTIPEPIGRPSDRSVAPAPEYDTRARAPADSIVSAPADTETAVPTDSAADEPPDSSSVPVPEPTQPLGDRPGSLASGALPDSVAPPPASAPPPAAPVSPSSPDSCWRVQVAAPPERDRADRLAAAARSQLVIDVVVEHEGGLYKVRTKDCLTAVAADDLKRRAIATGFEGAFRFLRKR